MPRMTVHFVLLLAGFICFVLSAVGVQSRANLQSAGLACWILTALI